MLKIKAWWPYALYTVMMAVLWGPYATYINADGVCYLSVAREYAQGHWWNAINTYWSPLFSWMIALGMALRMPASVAARIVMAVFGLAGLWALDSFAREFLKNEQARYGMLLAAAPMFAYFSVRDVTPEVLVVTLLLVYLKITCAAEDRDRAKWLLAGALGGLLYFAKAYSFAFVLVHLTLITGLRLVMKRQGTRAAIIVTNYARAIFALIAVSLPWLVLVSSKAGRPVLSTAGAYNFELARVGKGGHPMLSQGLFPPPNSDAVSVWEEPVTMPMERWNPLSSARLFEHELATVARNILEFVKYSLWATVFAPLIVVGFAWAAWKKWRAGETVTPWASLLVSYLLYPAGYFPIMFEHRYVWIDDVLVLVMGACVLLYLTSSGRVPARRVFALALIAGISFWCAPLVIAIKHRNDFRAEHELAERLRPLHPAGNAVSNAEWDHTLYLCYELGLPYYGKPAEHATEEAAAKQMQADAIRWIFLWNEKGVAMPLSGAHKVYEDARVGVYEVR